MDQYLLDAVYGTIIPAKPLAKDEEADEESEMAWSETVSIDDDAPLSPSVPAPSPFLPPFTCKVCHIELARGHEARLHIKLCTHSDPFETTRTKTTSKRIRAVVAEPRKRRRRAREYEVDAVLDHCEDSFLIRWTDDDYEDSWEPASNLLDKDEAGEITAVNAKVWEYAKAHDLIL
jgi:hypothetical protein